LQEIAPDIAYAAGCTPSRRGPRTAVTRTILEVVNLKKYYRQRAGILSTLRWRELFIPAVDGVSFYLKEHETLGSWGNPAAANDHRRTILRLTPATSGRIVFDGHDITAMPAGELRPLRAGCR